MNTRTSARAQLRSQLRDRRRRLSGADQQRHARSLLRRLRTLPAFRRARRIAVYLASDGEISLLPILTWLQHRLGVCYLPVLAPGITGPRLAFAPCAAHTRLALNRYGIPEPKAPRHRRLAAGGLDLILMPLVAFDTKGNRLGRGAGWYDRSLAGCRRPGRTRPALIGVAHDFQRVESLIAETWDIPLDGVCTERAFYRTRYYQSGPMARESPA